MTARAGVDVLDGLGVAARLESGPTTLRSPVGRPTDARCARTLRVPPTAVATTFLGTGRRAATATAAQTTAIDAAKARRRVIITGW
jgi:hypothetical protein